MNETLLDQNNDMPRYQKLIEDGHNIYQRKVLQDILETFGGDALVEFLKEENSKNTLASITTLRGCFVEREAIARKKLYEDLVPISIGDSDFDVEEFLRYERKDTSLKEYLLYQKLYEEQFAQLRENYKMWAYEDNFCTVKRFANLKELLRVCEFDDQGHQQYIFIDAVLTNELKALQVRDKTTDELIAYYYIQEPYLICVPVSTRYDEAGYTASETYAKAKGLTVIACDEDLCFTERVFAEELTKYREA